MNKSRIIYIAVAVMAMVFSCRNEDLLTLTLPPLTTDSGGYVRQVNVSSGIFNFFDLPNSKFALVVEVEDGAQGANTTSLDFLVSFRDNSPSNGTNSKPTEVLVKSVPGSALAVDGTSGLARTSVSVTFNETIAALGLTSAQVERTDVFTFRQVLKLTNGREYSVANSSPALVNGAWYTTPFRNLVPVVCPSALAGNYSAVTDWVDYYGEPGHEEYDATFTAAANLGQYTIKDLSGGMEPIIWGNPPVPATLQDLCGAISLVSAPYIYGYFVTGGSVNGNVITVEWENEYGEGGTTVYTKK